MFKNNRPGMVAQLVECFPRSVESPAPRRQRSENQNSMSSLSTE